MEVVRLRRLAIEVFKTLKSLHQTLVSFQVPRRYL